MELARPVVLVPSKSPSDQHPDQLFDVSVGPASVECLGVTDDGHRVCVARVAMDSPLTLADVPQLSERDELQLLNGAIAWTADIFTISSGQQYRVSALAPTLGLLGSPAELDPLKGADLGLRPYRTSMRVDDHPDVMSLATPEMADRPDGVALFAEALAHKNPLGRYGQLLRLLERAFGRGIGKFNRELQNYLADDATRHWFTPREIQHWVSSRPRIAHADRTDRPLWLHNDAAATVDRLQEATVDVLFNKSRWHSCDSARRAVRTPRRGTLDNAAGMFLTRGLPLTTRVRIADCFGAFPVYLKGGAERVVPPGLWTVGDGSGVRLELRGEATSLEKPDVRVASGPVLVYDPDDDSIRAPSED